MKTILLGLIMSVLLIASCSKGSPNATNNFDTSSNLSTLTVDIDGIPTAFDSLIACTYYTRGSVNDVIIWGYKRNDTSKSNIELMINAADTILSETYIDSVPNHPIFFLSYTPPNFISWFSGDDVSIYRPEIQISFIKDSVQGTFEGRLINILYYNSLPDTTYHELTNGKFNLKINHTSSGI